MKTWKVLLISIFAFALLLGSFFAFESQATMIEGAEAGCEPHFISLEDPLPQEFRITVTLPKPYKHEDIDPSTILVGGVVEMLDVPDWPKIKRNFFAFKVDGEALMYGVVLPEIWHMQLPPHTRQDVVVTVYGEFYGGEDAFLTTFTLTVFTEKEELDNPIPEP